MKLVCPKCRAKLPPQEINVQADMAKCPGCGEVHRASKLVHDLDAAEALKPLPGSRIALSVEKEEIRIHVPARGFRRYHPFAFFFPSFWILMIGFTIHLALQQPHVGPRLFLIPFAGVGIGMWWLVIVGARQRQILTIVPQEMEIRKTGGLWNSRKRIATVEIQTVSFVRPVQPTPWGFVWSLTRDNDHPGTMVKVPLIGHAPRPTAFGEFLSRDERFWLVDAVRAAIQRMSGRLPPRQDSD